MVDSFFLQCTLIKASMLSFPDKGFEVMLGLSIANTEQITPSAERVGNNICFA
ncbi:hypothetical protein Hanom_Chr15g01350341 [Helianthus anomalus]